MKYTDFRDQVIRELSRNKRGLTWIELKNKLNLPYIQPCPEWVKRMENENGLLREKGEGQAYIWKVNK